MVSGDQNLDDLEEDYFVELDFVELVACVAFGQSIVELVFAIAESVLPKSTLHHLHQPLREMKEGMCNEEPDFLFLTKSYCVIGE